MNLFDDMRELAHHPRVDRQPLLEEILDALQALLSRFVVFASPHQCRAVTLWIAHTYAIDAFDITPYLSLRSAEKRSGKTRLLEIIECLVPKPWRVVEPTEAVLFRKIEKDAPVLLLDEVDAIFKGHATPATEGLRAVLNAGYRRGATVSRCAGREKDKLVEFSTFCPKVLSGIGAPPDTVADRSIPIVLSRRTKAEPVARFRFRDVRREAAPVCEQFVSWATTATGTLREARPLVPEVLDDRAAEVWEPLIAIADLADEPWSAWARHAAVALHADRAEGQTVAVQLLRAIREVFDEHGRDRLLTLELLQALIERETDPWPSWWGKDVDRAANGEVPRKPAVELARYLRAFVILPKDIRIAGAKGKGYVRADFEDAFLRYLDPKEGDTATSPAEQGFEVSRKPNGDDPSETVETLGGQGMSPCLGKNGVCDDGHRRLGLANRADGDEGGGPVIACRLGCGASTSRHSARGAF
jgi:hypothetical protein